MLVRSGVDTIALSEAAGDGSAPFRAAHRQLIELLQSHGQLVFADADDRSTFLTAIRALPPSIRQLWTTALPAFLAASANPAIDRALAEVRTVPDLTAHWRARIEVAFFADIKARSLGLTPGDASFVEPTSKIEVTRIDLARESERFRRALNLVGADIPRNADRGDVWRERFEPLATAVKTVTILDRYAVDQLLRGQGQGLEWFLGRLDRSSQVHVHLIAQLDAPQRTAPACAALRALLGRLNAGGVQSLTVTFAPSAAFRDEAHSRHVRLGPLAVLIDRGLATFGGSRCSQSTPCIPGDRKSALEREQRVERQAWQHSRRLIL